MHIKVTARMEKFHGSRKDVALLLNMPGIKQAAHCLYHMLVKENKDQTTSSPSQIQVLLHLEKLWLALILSWGDDILALGCHNDVNQIEADLQRAVVGVR